MKRLTVQKTKKNPLKNKSIFNYEYMEPLESSSGESQAFHNMDLRASPSLLPI